MEHDWGKVNLVLFVCFESLVPFSVLYTPEIVIIHSCRLAYGLAKGGQTDSQVSSQVAKSRKFHAYNWLMRFYNDRLLAINLCRLALGGQTVKHLRPNLSSTRVHASRRKWVAKRNASWTPVQNLRRLANPFGQGLIYMAAFSLPKANFRLEIEKFQILICQKKPKGGTAFKWKLSTSTF